MHVQAKVLQHVNIQLEHAEQFKTVFADQFLEMNLWNPQFYCEGR